MNRKTKQLWLYIGLPVALIAIVSMVALLTQGKKNSNRGKKDISPSPSTEQVTPSLLPTEGITVSVTPDITQGVTPDVTGEITPSVTEEPTPTISGEPDPAVTDTPTLGISDTPTPTKGGDATLTPEPTKDSNPTPTVDPDDNKLPIFGPSPEPGTPTVPPTPSVTPVPTVTIPPTPTGKPTVTVTPTVIPTGKPGNTPSVKPTEIPTISPAALSKDASITSMVIIGANTTPVFQTKVLNYTATVTSKVSSVYVMIELADEKAKVVTTRSFNSNGSYPVTIEPYVDDTSGSTTVTPTPIGYKGQYTYSIDLAQGLNRIEFTVTAEDGVTKQSYVISITKQAAPGATVSPTPIQMPFVPISSFE